MKYLIYGGFGYGSLGDEMILTAELDIFGRNNCTVVSYDPIETSRMHEVESIRTDQIINYTNYDTLVIGGGGTIVPGSTVDLLKISKNAISKGKRVEVFRVGIYGDDQITDYKAIMELYKSSNRFTVRCQVVKERMKKYCNVDVNIEECCAALGKKSSKLVIDSIFDGLKVSRDKIIIGIHCKNVADVIQYYIPICEYLLSCSGFIELIAINTCMHKIDKKDNDWAAIEAINSQLKGGKIKNTSGPWSGMLHPNEMKGVLAELNLLIANRKHPSICAAAEGIPVIIIDNDGAIAEMAPEIKNIGIFEISKTKPIDVINLIRDTL